MFSDYISLPKPRLVYTELMDSQFLNLVLTVEVETVNPCCLTKTLFNSEKIVAGK